MRLYLTGQDSTQDITDFILQVQWSGDEASVTRQLSFSILYEEEAGWPVPKVGGAVTLEEGKTLFNGWVVKRTLDSESISMDCVCYDGGMYLKNNDYTGKFRQETAEGMVAAACGEKEIPVAELAKTGAAMDRKFSAVAIDKLVRTAYSLASERTGERYAIRMRPDGLAVTVRQQSQASVDLRPRSNLMRAATTESIVGMVNSVGIYDQQGQRVTTVADSAAKVLYGTMERHLRQTESNDPYAEAEALLADNGFSQNVQVEVLGDVRLVTGETVMVREEHTGLAGLFWIDADTHTWKRDQYTCKLTLNCRNVMTRTNAGSEEL